MLYLEALVSRWSYQQLLTDEPLLCLHTLGRALERASALQSRARGKMCGGSDVWQCSSSVTAFQDRTCCRCCKCMKESLLPQLDGHSAFRDSEWGLGPGQEQDKSSLRMQKSTWQQQLWWQSQEPLCLPHLVLWGCACPVPQPVVNWRMLQWHWDCLRDW